MRGSRGAAGAGPTLWPGLAGGHLPGRGGAGAAEPEPVGAGSGVAGRVSGLGRAWGCPAEVAPGAGAGAGAGVAVALRAGAPRVLRGRARGPSVQADVGARSACESSPAPAPCGAGDVPSAPRGGPRRATVDTLGRGVGVRAAAGLRSTARGVSVQGLAMPGRASRACRESAAPRSGAQRAEPPAGAVTRSLASGSGSASGSPAPLEPSGAAGGPGCTRAGSSRPQARSRAAAMASPALQPAGRRGRLGAGAGAGSARGDSPARREPLARPPRASLTWRRRAGPRRGQRGAAAAGTRSRAAPRRAAAPQPPDYRPTWAAT